ncbi:hypothetical protein C0991_011591 [Blastosporella zonata]|nr:hypothetical protein C0991_011591 [Blastosporella zonata]
MTQSTDDAPYQQEKERKDAVCDLHLQLVLYTSIDTSTSENDEREERQARNVVNAMYRVSDAHTNPEVKAEYKRKAKKFEEESSEQRRGKVNGSLTGLGILIASPFMFAGAATFVAGSIVYGVGSVLMGLGDLMTAGVWGS